LLQQPPNPNLELDASPPSSLSSAALFFLLHVCINEKTKWVLENEANVAHRRGAYMHTYTHTYIHTFYMQQELGFLFVFCFTV